MNDENLVENSQTLIDGILSNENEVQTPANIVQTSVNIDEEIITPAKKVQKPAKTLQKKNLPVPKPAKTVQNAAKTLKTLQNVEKVEKQRFAVTINFSEDEFAHLNTIIAECKQLKTSENNGQFIKQCIDFAINHDFVHKTLVGETGYICFTPTENIANITNKLFKGSVFKGIEGVEELG